MAGHIHPDVRKLVSKHALGVKEFEPWHCNGGARLICSSLDYIACKGLIKKGFVAGGIRSRPNGSVMIFIEKL